MALRDQPYLPLYIKDFMTDEKLMTCTAATTGVYIRLMCVMHKSEIYGTILLKQKFKQTNKQINNFASQLVNFMPYDLLCIQSALIELIDEEIIKIDGDFLIQKRMVKDADISEKRANAGKKGGEETQKIKPKNNKKFAKAKNKANTVNAYVDENENGILSLNLKVDSVYKKIIDHLNLSAGTKYKENSNETVKVIKARLADGFNYDDFIIVIDKMIDKWGTDEKMCEFIRPVTLFGNKFEGYLNLVHAMKNKKNTEIGKAEIALSSHDNFMKQYEQYSNNK